MQRILVVGSGGAGKSTLALDLGRVLGLPVFHLDALFWQPGWIQTPLPDRVALLEQLVQSELWILDGHWGGTAMELRLAAADTVVWLDLPRVLCLRRAIQRWAIYRGRTRPDLGSDCPEHWDWEYLKWVWEFPSVHRPRLLERIEKFREDRTVVHLRSPADVGMFLNEARALGRASPVRDPRPVSRPAGRVILLDSDGRVLLWRVDDPNVDAPSLWVTPGGALEPGESYEDAALRELCEETGLSGVTLGPWVWHRRHVWRWGDHWYDSEERFFLVRVDSFEVDASGQSAEEMHVMREYRWWSVDELTATRAEIFVPRRLAELLPHLVAGEVPTESIWTGI